jgi:hypothetical protein
MLYSKEFLERIPQPESQEGRSLVNIKANHPWLLERLNGWYSELLPDGNPSMKSRLQSLNSKDFTSAFWELVMFRFLRKTGHDVLYEGDVEDKTPDFRWQKQGLIGDVISVSDPHYGKREEVFVHEIAGHLDRLSLPFDVFITSFGFSGTSYRRSDILNLFISLAKRPLSDLIDQTYEYDDGESQLEFMISPRSSSSSIKGIGMFELDAGQLKEVVKRRIRKKVKKYHGSLVVFACSGLGFWHLTEETLNFALYGDLQVLLMKDLKAKRVKGYRETRATNGVFNNRQKNGRPANNRLLAVLFVDRFVEERKLFLRIKVFHNPFATPCLPTGFFGGCTQFVPHNATKDEITLKWFNKDLSVVELT